MVKKIENAYISGHCYCGFDSVLDICVYVYSSQKDRYYSVNDMEYMKENGPFMSMGEYFFDKDTLLSNVIGQSAQNLMKFACKKIVK